MDRDVRIAMIDNYDSFTYNLVQYMAELGAEPQVFRNDEVTVDELAKFDGIVISPGPGTPDDAGVSNDAIRALSGNVAILGVCLGHQCIGQVFGGEVVRNEPSHGKTSWTPRGRTTASSWACATSSTRPTACSSTPSRC